ncbi:MAG: hypothetical protein HOM11_00840 [Methylococcales bacterium]|mgnify:CR=1 FL=1|jgi:Ca2+/H+ antiporter, TMEM165/GDT1 family|nr:hypothetical protein [Methylococcales bacterium]MBT7444980.1 hypothetical protein [Methylococcales bacterium]
MNLEKVVFSFFIVLALTLNFGFFLGDIDNPLHHNIYEFFAALVVSLAATILKFGDRSSMGTLLLASSLVADLQLIVAAIIWGFATEAVGGGLATETITSIVSLSGGALLANLVSVTLLLIETAILRR